MSDWQVGDLAVCVDARPHPQHGPIELREGCTYRVTRVWSGGDSHIMYGIAEAGLELAEVISHACEGFASNRFRKIRPDKREPCEEEFVTLLKRSKRTVTATDWLLRAGPIAKQLNEDARKERQ